MPRFVILEHNHPSLHWDLMLEQDGVLRTWRLAAPPEHSGAEVAAGRSFDHRLLYLDHEGPVSGNRGIVRRWDGGEYRLEDERPGRLLLWFDGARVQGRAVLEGNELGWTFRREDSALTKGEPGGGGSRARQDTQKQPPDEPLPAP